MPKSVSHPIHNVIQRIEPRYWTPARGRRSGLRADISRIPTSPTTKVACKTTASGPAERTFARTGKCPELPEEPGNEGGQGCRPKARIARDQVQSELGILCFACYAYPSSGVWSSIHLPFPPGARRKDLRSNPLSLVLESRP